jgi:hypothetical protein
MSLNEAATFTFYCADKHAAVEGIYARLIARSLTRGPRETERIFEYFRLCEPTRLRLELRVPYELNVGTIERTRMSVVDPLECWFVTPSADRSALRDRLNESHWQSNTSLPEGFRIVMKEGEATKAAGSDVVSVITTVANARYLAFALAESGVIADLGPAYISF